MRLLPTIILMLMVSHGFSQQRPVVIESETKANRIMLYAVNQNEIDLDVLLTVSGSNFRQSAAKPRWYRVPAASKVPIKSLIQERDKTARYRCEVEVRDSLSRRAIRKPSEQIKIKPKAPLKVYRKENCLSCDSIINGLNNSYYLFEQKNLEDEPKMKEYLVKAFENSVTPFDSITNPVIILGGKYYYDISTYEQLRDTLKVQ